MKRLQKIFSLSLAVLMAMTAALPLRAAAAKSFTDTRGHWASQYIADAVSRGYVNGYENGSFKPNGSVTRAEFCKMINSALGLTSSDTIDFLDVSSNNWFYTDVRRAVAAGYISGYEDRSFRANDQITRQEAAVIISRIVAASNAYSDLSQLRDNGSISPWALDSAKTVFAKGYMAGDSNKKFNPNGKLTRAEAVKIIETILDGEPMVSSDLSISSPSQLRSDTVYTGNVTLNLSSGSDVTFQNCRILGSLQVSRNATVRLLNTKVSRLEVGSSCTEAEIIASGSSAVSHATLSGGCTLSESSLYGSGFEKVTLTGSSLGNDKIYLSGDFSQVNLQSPTTVKLTSGSITHLNIASGGRSSTIDLASRSSVEKLELSGACDFTGKGSIYKAVLHVGGSTFETAPVFMEGKVTLVPSITPANGANDVALNSSIRLSFNEAVYTSSRSTPSSSYLESSVLELRKRTESGTRISFSASLSSNQKTITLTPDDDLERDTKYYVIVKSALKNREGVSNERTVFSFYTGGNLVPEVYPLDGSDTIPVNTKLTLTFEDPIYQRNGSYISTSSSYLTDSVLSLRRGSSSGTAVSITASLSSDKKLITIYPRDNLSTDTKYYLILKGNSISSGGETNNEQIFSFTTADSSVLVPVVTPASGSTKVDTNTDIELSFDTALYTDSGSSYLSASYLEDEVFTLRRGSSSGSSVSLSASINSSRRVITLTPDDELREDTTYYLIMDGGSLSDSASSSRRYNPKMIFSFTTKEESSGTLLEPTPSPRYGESGVSTGTNITLTFDEAIYQNNSSRSSLTSSYLRNSVIELRRGSSSGDTVSFSADYDSYRKRITITPSSSLSTNTRYYVILEEDSIQNSSGDENSRYVTYFTCGSSSDLLKPEMNPSDGALGASPNTDITLYFDEAIYDRDGSRLSDNSSSRSYLQNYVISLRADRENGTQVPITVDSISSYRRVTFTPDKRLTENTTYYVILADGKLQNSDGVTNKKQVLRFTVGSGLEMTVTPKQGDSNVSRTTPITLSFNEKLYSSTYDELTSSNITSYMQSIATLKSSRGSTVGFTASISSGRVITLRPTSPLEANGYYTLTIGANKLGSYGGARNAAVSISFSTNGSVLTPTITPENGSTGVSTKPSITLSFGETLYNASGSLLTSGDAVAEIRTSSSDGAPIAFNSTVLNSREITLTPKTELSKGTRYYVILRENTVTNDRSGTNKNTRQTFYFTTVAETPIPAPSLIDMGVSSDGSQTIELRYGTPLFTTGAEKVAVTNAYLAGKVSLYQGSNSGTLVPTTATISGDGKVISLKSDTPLLAGTSYLVSIPAAVFQDGSDNKSLALSQSFTTKLPSVTVTSENVSARTATVKIDCDYPGTISVSLDGVPYGDPATVTEPTVLSYPLDELALDTTYLVTATLTYGGDKTLISTHSFKTTNSKLDTLLVSDSTAHFTVDSKDPANCTMSYVLEDTTLTLIPTPTDPNASVTVDSTVVSPSSGYEVSLNQSGNTVVTIIVTSADGTSTTTYTLTITRP